LDLEEAFVAVRERTNSTAGAENAPFNVVADVELPVVHISVCNIS